MHPQLTRLSSPFLLSLPGVLPTITLFDVKWIIGGHESSSMLTMDSTISNAVLSAGQRAVHLRAMLFFNLPLIFLGVGHIVFMLSLLLPEPLSQPSIALTQWSNSK